jgi:hypothetical protein
MESQRVKTPEASGLIQGDAAGQQGQGRKRHLRVATLGLRLSG